MACGVLVPPSRIEPGPSAVRAQSPNRWTAKDFPLSLNFSQYFNAFVQFIALPSQHNKFIPLLDCLEIKIEFSY